VATLAAFDLATTPAADLGWPAAVPLRSAHSFGSPRVGNEKFAARFAVVTSGASWRVTWIRDLFVQAVKATWCDWGGPGGCYHHVSREVWYPHNGTAFTVCDGSGEDPACQLSVDADNPLDHEQYLGLYIDYCDR
jgi:hypothetical protein